MATRNLTVVPLTAMGRTSYIVVDLDAQAELSRHDSPVDAARAAFDAQAEHAAKQETQRKARNAKARSRAAGIRDAMASVGVKRVRGALGGTYWE